MKMYDLRLMTYAEKVDLQELLKNQPSLNCRRYGNESFSFIMHMSPDATYHITVHGLILDTATTETVDHYISLGLQMELLHLLINHIV